MAAQLRGPVTTATAESGSAEPGRGGYGSAGPVARVRGLSRVFGGRAVLDGLDIDIAPGEFIAMIGRSGSGKSTLLRALAGLDREVTGEVEVSGTTAVAFQEPRLVPWKRVAANIRLGLRVPRPDAVAAAALAEVGLTDRAGAWPLTLSGGEAQRASLARALDALTTIAMHQLVLRLWAQHRPAVLLVTHDVDEALTLADRILVLAEGRIGYSCRIDAPRPRDRDHPDLITRRAELLAELGITTEGIA
jgi:sulfonate transport system ATP-binding protein